MKIGIKFCGGCNPFYDRGAVARKYIEDHPEYDFEYIMGDDEYDFVVIVCGCMIMCTAYDHIKSKYGYYVVSSEKDFDRIKEKLEEAVAKHS